VVFTEAGKPDDAIVRIDSRSHMRVVCARALTVSPMQEEIQPMRRYSCSQQLVEVTAHARTTRDTRDTRLTRRTGSSAGEATRRVQTPVGQLILAPAKEDPLRRHQHRAVQPAGTFRSGSQSSFNVVADVTTITPLAPRSLPSRLARRWSSHPPRS
jgi:hypothetical protein